MKNLIKTIIVICAVWQLSACSQSNVNTTEPSASETSPVAKPAGSSSQKEANLSIISYNLKGIPPIFASDVYTEHNSERATEFSNYLKTRVQQGTAPDVVLLQEIFAPTFLTTIISNSNYPYHYTDYTENYTLGNVVSGEIKAVPSGLLILSKYPITESAVHHFPSSLCAVEDCYAKKGVLWVKIQKPGVPFPIDVFNTHIQARTAQESIREQQIKDMKSFVSSRVDKAKAVFFGGDFNFRISERYQADDLFVSTFKLIDSFSNCLQSSDCKNDFQAPRVKGVTDLLDHVFYKTNPNAVEVKVTQARSSEQKITFDGKENHLSDHPMLEMSYLLRWK
jgi:endonuclease/exonuclease/phosphatase family metal-dependent hydrolase